MLQIQKQQQKKRRYQAIWERIRRLDLCEILIKNSWEAETVKRGVIKEKDRDLNFKVLNDGEPYRLKIKYEKETGKMSFQLVTRLGMKEKVI